MPQGAVQFARYQADRRRILAKANTCRVSQTSTKQGRSGYFTDDSLASAIIHAARSLPPPGPPNRKTSLENGSTHSRQRNDRETKNRLSKKAIHGTHGGSHLEPQINQRSGEES
jgi:hypothetical protein